MKSKKSEEAQRILVLLKLDANGVFNRIKSRKTEYLEIFALRRTREHFPKIFKSRYWTIGMDDLANCGTDLIATLDQFYTFVDELDWYLYQTEDMPNTVENYVDRKIRQLEKLLASLNLFLDAELGIHGHTEEVLSEAEPEDFPDAFEDDTQES
jgi:hypothetical protein